MHTLLSGHLVHDIYPITKDEFLKLLRRHWSKLLIASSLLATVHLLVLLATCALRRALSASTAAYYKATASERVGLMEGDDDDSGAQVI